MASTEDLTPVPLTFQKGLFEGLEQSVLPAGFAPVLENWVPEAVGCLRCRRGWNATPVLNAFTNPTMLVDADVNNVPDNWSVVYGAPGSPQVTAQYFQFTPPDASSCGYGQTVLNILPGQQYAFTVEGRIVSGGGHWQFEVVWQDAGGTSMRTDYSPSYTDAALTRQTYTPGVAPTGTTKVRVTIFAQNAGPVQFRNAQLIPAAKARGIGVYSRYVGYGGYLAQGANSTMTSANSKSATWSKATGAGSLLILYVYQNATNPTFTATGWTQAVKSATLPCTAIYYKENAASESGAVTVTSSATADFAIRLEERPGMATSSSLDKTATNSGTSITPSSGTTAATTQAFELAVAVLGDTRNEAQTGPSNSFTQQADFGGGTGNGNRMATYDKQLSVTGTQTVSATTANSDTWVGCIATFKAAFVGSYTRKFFVAHQGSSTYDIYYTDAETIATQGFTLLEQVSAPSVLTSVAFTMGLGKLFYTNEKFATLRQFDGSTVSAVTATTGTVPVGRCIAFHKNTLFVGGTLPNPTRLWYSKLGSATEWPVDNYVEIGQDDGEPIEDIAPTTQGLIIVKETSVHLLTGSGRDSFQVVQLNGGGAAPGRAIMPTPFGVLIAGRDDVWFWSGQGVELISRPIESSYAWTGDFMSCSYIDETVYICDEGTGKVWAFHVPSGNWRTETVTPAAIEGPAVLYNQGDTQLFGPQAATVGSLLSYRMFPSSPRGRDAGLTEKFHAKTPEMWLGGPDHTLTPRFLYLQLRQRGGDSSQRGAALNVTPIYDGQAKDVVQVLPRDGAPLTFFEKVQVGSTRGVSSVQFDLESDPTSAETALFDIESAVLYCLVHGCS